MEMPTTSFSVLGEALVRAQHPFGEGARPPRLPELLVRAGLDRAGRDPDDVSARRSTADRSEPLRAVRRTSRDLRSTGKGEGHEEGSTAPHARSESSRPPSRPRRFVGAVGPIAVPTASSHREAPLIADDPAADNTDVYAFVSPDDGQSTSRRLDRELHPVRGSGRRAELLPFDPNVLYEIERRQRRRRRRGRRVPVPVHDDDREPEHVPLQHGSAHVRRPTRTSACGRRTRSRACCWTTETSISSTVIGSNLPVPPPNIGPRSNPSYDPFMGVASLGGNRKVFAGPRDDPFFVDLGSIFDLAGLRPFNSLHADPARERGRAGRRAELQHALDRDPGPEDGPPATAPCANGNDRGLRECRAAEDHASSARTASVDTNGHVGPGLAPGNPLVNEVIIPLGKKDRWNASDPADDAQFLQHYTIARARGAREHALCGADRRFRRPIGSDLVAVLLDGRAAG